MNPARVDPSLPCVDLHVVRCPGCRQTLLAIRDGGRFLPDAHYPEPTWVVGVPSPIVATERGGRKKSLLCSFSGDDLTSVLYRAQREAAGLPPPRLSVVAR